MACAGITDLKRPEFAGAAWIQPISDCKCISANPYLVHEAPFEEKIASPGERELQAETVRRAVARPKIPSQQKIGTDAGAVLGSVFNPVIPLVV